jgi:hypothetical protein
MQRRLYYYARNHALLWPSFSARANRIAETECFRRNTPTEFGVKSDGLPIRGGEGHRFAIPSPNNFILIYSEPPGLHG